MSKPPPEKMKDPRDIRDRGYQQHCVRSLITFLTETGYDRTISTKILSAPTAKDFQHIFMFLYHQIDPSYEFLGKIEDEVPVLIRGLKYPFYSDISKSHLLSVGSLHAWPSILAMLTWMVELILVSICAFPSSKHKGNISLITFFFFFSLVVPRLHQPAD